VLDMHRVDLEAGEGDERPHDECEARQPLDGRREVADALQRDLVRLRREVRAGRLDGDAAEDVLTAAGHTRTGVRERARAAGLTARELEVLLLVARRVEP
jgi:hypothetical protein